MMTTPLFRRLVRRFPTALLALPLAGCMSLADYGEAPGYERGYPDYPREADGWYGRDVASVDIFYGSLGRYGRWDVHPGYGRVFVPVGVSSGWQPYSQGYWATDPRFGRRWVSSEPFGWATYHYGRWARDQRLGWFWVPDTRYGPGWVNWREGGGYSGWSPLPPLGWERWGVGYDSWGYNGWGWDSWLFAPSLYLYSPGLHGHIVRGRPHYDRTRPVGRPDWQGDRPNGRPNWQKDRPGGWTENVRPDGEPRPRGERPVPGWQGEDGARPDGNRQPRPGLQRDAGDRPDWQGRPADERRVQAARGESGRTEAQPYPGQNGERQRPEVRQAAAVQAQPQQAPAQQAQQAPQAQAMREPQVERRASMREMPARQPD